MPTETDPLGKAQHEPGAKLDAGKPRPFLVLGGFHHGIARLAACLDTTWVRYTSPDLASADALDALLASEYGDEDAVLRAAVFLTGYFLPVAPKNDPILVRRQLAVAFIDVVKVGTLGAAKYTDYGWAAVPQAGRRYTDAAVRHLVMDGNSEDFQLPHIAHAMWNLLAILSIDHTLSTEESNGPALNPDGYAAGTA